jgi:regulatory protein YycI of two-component signal transduction system YycFG
MKLNVEIEIDWIDEEGNLDEEIERKIISGLTSKIEQKFLKDAAIKVAAAADKLITAKTELLINNILERPVKVSNGWNDNREYDSIFEMVESRMSNMYGEKLNNSGKCTKDPLLAHIESYIEKTNKSHLDDITRRIEKHADLAAKTALKENKTLSSLQAMLEKNP